MQAVVGLIGRSFSRSGAAAFLLLLSLGCLGSVSVARAAGGDLTVEANGVEVGSIPASALGENEDVAPNLVAVHHRTAGPGESAPNLEYNPGTSFAEVARLVGISPKSLAGNVTVTIAGQSAPVVSLTVSEALGGIPNPIEPSLPSGFPVFRYYGAESTWLYVPLRSLEDPAPWGATISSTSFVVGLSVTKEILKVAASCTPARVGANVECTAEPVEGGAGWAYTWDFGDKSDVVTTTERSVKHPYSAPGNYAVHLTVESTTGEGARQVKVRVETAQAPEEGGETEGGTGSGEAHHAPAPSSEPRAARPGSGESSPDSVSNGPDQSQAIESSKGQQNSLNRRKRKKHKHEAKSLKARAAQVRPGVGGGPGTGGAAGTGVGEGAGGEGGESAGPGAADQGPNGAVFEQALSRVTPAPRGKKSQKTSADVTPTPMGPLVEGLLLNRVTGSGSIVERDASAQRQSERLQQAASGGQGSPGSVVGPLAGAAVLLLVLGLGAGAELISAGRRTTWTLGASS